MSTDPPLELWGGLECTVARIGDTFRDQGAETGHRDRAGDLDLIAGLGIRTLRYPVIWETVSPEQGGMPDWSWHDERLARLRQLGIRPIAGLVHHGSGPAHTSLLDPAFPRLLARHAAAVARRYPWIDAYTPVNEPLTTARFSGLYGHWYPHERSYGAFLRALVNECRAVVLSTRAIRRIRPDAKLVQTDDFGKTFSTPLLAYQAEHENERRWLSFDLLCGRVVPGHPFWRILRDHGIGARELDCFRDGEGAPDIIGINHYLTSERFLDQRLQRYPEHLWGGNGRQRYADAEAVRINLPERDLGPAARLREVWERYRRPIAVTEAHHGCTRDEQLRWLMEVWRGAETVRAEGADIRAVTIWSLFGTVDWNTLLTQQNGIYEPGPYDVRGPSPRPTALAHAAEALAKTGDYDHPVLDRLGWWRRESRFYRPVKTSGAVETGAAPRELLVMGGGSALAEAFSQIAIVRGLDHRVLGRRQISTADPDALAAALRERQPWAVIDTIGIPGLAEACARLRLPLVAFSDDRVFDGALGRPYEESDSVSPLNAAGQRQVEQDALVLAQSAQSLLVRAGPLFGPWDGKNVLWSMLAGLAAGRGVTAGPGIVSPTYMPDLAHVTLDLLIDGATGLWHVPNPGAIAWIDLARNLAERAGLPQAVIRPERSLPLQNALTSGRGLLLPPLESALDRFFRDCEVDWAIGNRSLAAE